MSQPFLMDADKCPPTKAKTRPPAKPKTKRERIQLMEVVPRGEWFQRATDEWGRPIWFIRIQITGLRTRRYGPFPTKHRGLLFLDKLLDVIGEALLEAKNELGSYQGRRRPYRQRGDHYPVVEDALIDLTIQKGR